MAAERTTEQVRTTCCVVGGGPAGLMAGVLLARQGVDVVVLEKHGDFLRDFRGDTLHPSTLELMAELGWLEDVLALPHTRVERATVSLGGETVVVGRFDRLPVRCPFIAFLPQWDFLDLLAEKGEAMPGFRLLRSTAADGLLVEDGRCTGVTAHDDDGAPVRIRAELVLAADGRDSVLRAAAGLVPRASPSRMDVLWFRVPRREGQEQPLFNAGDGAVVALPRTGYWQAAMIVRAGEHDARTADGQAPLDHVGAAGLVGPERAAHAGGGPECCSSATQPTRCPRPGAWASTSRSRTRSRRRTCSGRGCCAAGCGRGTSSACATSSRRGRAPA